MAVRRPPLHRRTLRPGEQVQVLGRFGQVRVRSLGDHFDVQDRGPLAERFVATIPVVLLFDEGSRAEFRLENSAVSVSVARAGDGSLLVEHGH